MFGHERSLVQRFNGRPFVLLGVNADASPQRLRQVQEKAQLTWASWWDGPEGPIGMAWGVDRYPAFFLVDPQGVVRWRHFGAPAQGVLEGKIEDLLREAPIEAS
jgi:hypothetical protein